MKTVFSPCATSIYLLLSIQTPVDISNVLINQNHQWHQILQDKVLSSFNKMQPFCLCSSSTLKVKLTRDQQSKFGMKNLGLKQSRVFQDPYLGLYLLRKFYSKPSKAFLALLLSIIKKVQEYHSTQLGILKILIIFYIFMIILPELNSLFYNAYLI